MSRFVPAALVALLALAALAPAASAQSNDARRVVLVDGTVIVGVVVDESADPVVIRTANGVEQRVPRSQVVEITELLDGRFTRYDPARTRLFFSPTARSLGAGAKRFSAYYLFPSLAVGLSDRVDLSFGSTIPLVSSEGAFLGLNGNAKVTLIEQDGFAAALGGSVSIPLSTEDTPPGVFGTIYALTTIGGEAGAVTLGAYGFYVTSFEDGVDSELGDGAALLLGLERQLSDRFKFISENYVVLAFVEDDEFDPSTGGSRTVNSTEALFGTLTGVRFFGDRLAADIAVALGAYEGEFSTIPIPYLGMSYTF